MSGIANQIDLVLATLKKLSLGTSLAIQWLRLRFHCRGHGFNPYSGNKDPTCHVVWSKKMQEIESRFTEQIINVWCMGWQVL